jgi:hypothetical protein
MSEDTKVPSKGSDWTRLLTDPDLVSHLGKLLQTYRDVAPDEREAALLRAMREIKDAAIKDREKGSEKSNESQQESVQPAQPPLTEPQLTEPQTTQSASEEETGPQQAQADVPATVAPAPAPPAFLHHPEPVKETEAPPFEADMFQSEAESDRRRFQRLKCYVAVEIHVEGLEKPVWGNLANVSRGGCLVETASAVPPGKILEIGLWVASGKIWVKGVMISGVATRSSSSFGIRVKFSQSELSEKEHLREFLKFVEGNARKSQSGNAYVAQLKT